MTLSRGIKKGVLLGGLLGLGILAALRLWPWAAAVGLALFAWLCVETRARMRFRFSEGGLREKGWDFDTEVLDLRAGASAVFIHPGGVVSVAPLEGGGSRRPVFERTPLALLPLAGERLLLAYEERLALCDLTGRELGGLAFEAPLLRQAYRLLLSPDGAWGALVTPWFAQVFDSGLKGLHGRVRFEDAGHYIKYAAIAPQGRGLLLGGAYLLDEESGGALEARWDWWEREGEAGWVRRWGQAREGYENSQLRGVQLSADGAVLCTELYRSDYAFELRKPDSTLLWENRGGERPLLSPGGVCVAWEKGPDSLVLSRQDGTERWRYRFKERIRLKRPLDDGSCVALEGRCLRRFSPTGEQGPEIWLKNDAEQIALGAHGTLVLAAGRHGACLRIDGGS
jgi:hypothetical protein